MSDQTPSPTAERTPPAKPGPKLSPAQRDIVRLLAMRLDSVKAVQARLQAEYPDIPTVTPRTIRTLRKEAQQPQDEAMRRALQAEQDAAIRSGLARKANRVAEINHLYARISQAVDQATDVAALAGLLPQARGLLAAAAKEMEQFSPVEESLAAQDRDIRLHGQPVEEVPTIGNRLDTAVTELMHMFDCDLDRGETYGEPDFSNHPPRLQPIFDQLASCVYGGWTSGHTITEADCEAAVRALEQQLDERHPTPAAQRAAAIDLLRVVTLELDLLEGDLDEEISAFPGVIGTVTRMVWHWLREDRDEHGDSAAVGAAET